MPNRIFGLIPAAGVGSRMGAEVPKQYMMLGGRSMLEHSVRALFADDRVEHVLVVVAPGDAMARSLMLGPAVTVEPVGGETRAQSVRNGLWRLADAVDNDDWVLVHDAARPCLSAAELTHFIDVLADETVGGLLAIQMSDTVKRTEFGRVAETIDRSDLWRAATPQMFRFGVLQRALDRAEDWNLLTDEASAVEYFGLMPLVIPCYSSNLKVTTVEDLPIAEAVLRAQGRIRS